MRDQDMVLESSALAKKLIHDLHDRFPDHESFEQVGLLEGHEIVADFIKHGELGCALNHLLYMIHEVDIAYPRERVIQLHALAKKIGEKNPYSKESQANLGAEQIGAIYNAP